MERAIFLLRKYFGPIHEFKYTGHIMQCAIKTPGLTSEELQVTLHPPKESGIKPSHVLISGEKEIRENNTVIKKLHTYELVSLPIESREPEKELTFHTEHGVTLVSWAPDVEGADKDS